MRNAGSVNIQLLGESFCSNGQGKKLPQPDSGNSKRPLAKWVTQGGKAACHLTLLLGWKWGGENAHERFSSVWRGRIWCVENSLMEEVQGEFWSTQSCSGLCLWGRSCSPSYSLSPFIWVTRIKPNLSMEPCSAFVSTETPKMMGMGGEAAPDIQWGRQSQSYHTKHCWGS